MFFVTLLLNEMVSWMRGQPGTTSLRALLYMDEIFGYFPPSKNPPSKTPMLTLLKQARAFGVGVVLATQNPVDLDYKGLSNTGTWFLGRLQTERDKRRVIDGLEGASATTGGAFDRQAMEATLSGLGKRVFLLHNVHDDEPVLFHTRWVLSYLRGPLTRSQIQQLTADRKAAAAAAPVTATPGKSKRVKAKDTASQRPLLPAAADEAFALRGSSLGDGQRLVYRPALLAEARLHFVRVAAGLDLWQEETVLALLDGDSDPWEDSSRLEEGLELDVEPEDEASFDQVPSAASDAKAYPRWSKALVSYLYRERTYDVWKSPLSRSTPSPARAKATFGCA